MLAKATITLLLWAAIFAVILLGAAGRIDWVQGWILLALFWLPGLGFTFVLAKLDPALLAERMKPPVQEGQPLWDRIFMLAMGITFVGWLVAMGLDAGRYRWSHMPVWLSVLGAAMMLASWWLNYRVARANTFLASVVRIQTERGQHVISTGPYAVVRHPFYSSAALLMFGTALVLGSWLGVGLAAVLVAFMSTRVFGEERELRAKLPGYDDYAAKVRYRLIPYIW